MKLLPVLLLTVFALGAAGCNQAGLNYAGTPQTSRVLTYTSTVVTPTGEAGADVRPDPNNRPEYVSPDQGTAAGRSRNFGNLTYTSTEVTNSGQPAGGPRLDPRVKVENTEFDKHIKVIGFTEKHGPDYGSVPVRLFFIRSWIDKKSFKVAHQIYISDYYEGRGWTFWNGASDQDANTLNFDSIDRSVGSCAGGGGCQHFETFGVSVSDDYLRAKQETGFRIQIRAKSGETKVITIGPTQIRSQLATIDTLLPLLPPPAPTPSAPAAVKKPAPKKSAPPKTPGS